MILQNGIDALCAPRWRLHPTHRGRLCCVTAVWTRAICGLKVLHKSLFIFLPLCFPSASLSLSLSRSIKDMCRLCVQGGGFTAARCGRVNSVCTAGRLLGVCFWMGFVCSWCWTPLQDRRVCPLRHADRKQRMSGMLRNNKSARQVPAPSTFQVPAPGLGVRLGLTSALSLHLSHTSERLFIRRANVLQFPAPAAADGTEALSLCSPVCDFIFECDGACVSTPPPPWAQSDGALLLVCLTYREKPNPRRANVFPSLPFSSEDRPSRPTHTQREREREMNKCENRDLKLYNLPMNNLSGTCVCVCQRKSEQIQSKWHSRRHRFCIDFPSAWPTCGTTQ